ncbi:MAG: hypothetical protein ACFB6R_02820 [Alphaproteobacteria bacterium]
MMTRTVFVTAAAVVLLGACVVAPAPGRNIDRDGRRDFDDTPRERVCCKFRGGGDYVTTRRACFRRNGRPVSLVRCRIY